MGILRKEFNSDSKHQYIVSDNDLYSVDILFDKNDIKNYMSQLLDYSNNTECLLVNDQAYKKYDFPIKMHWIGYFSIIKGKEPTMNYLIPNNKLLFLLNYFYKKMDKKISLNHNDLKILEAIENKFVIESKETELKIIEELKNKIIFNVKGIYDYTKVKNITIDSFNLLLKEGLMVNVLSISGVLDNALDNREVLNSLGIKLNKGFQKTKA